MAREMHAAGQIREAIPLYERTLALEPRNYDATYLLGIALYQLGEAASAIPYLKAATRLRPDALQAQRDLGLILLQLGAHGEAEAAFAQASRIDPDNVQVLVNRGIALKNLGRLEEAAACQRRALARQPDFAEAHHHLGNALLALGQPAEALACFGRARELKPALAEAWQGAGQALLDLDRTAEAVMALREAVRRNPATADVHRALALALLRAGQGEEALSGIDRALAIAPASAAAHAARGAILERLDDGAGAGAAYATALQLEPDNVDALLGEAGLLRKQDATDAALALYDRAIALAPRRGDAYFGAGLAFMRKREFAPAARSFDEALKHMPGVASLHYHRGTALRELDMLADAVEAFDKAIAADPAHIDSYLAKAQLLSNEHRCEESLAVLEAMRAFDRDKDRGLGQRFADCMQMCNWSSYAEDLARIGARIAAGDTDLGSFNVLAHIDDPALQKRCAENVAGDLLGKALPSFCEAPGRNDGRITVAYVSGDFRDHATMYLMADVFEHHDRSRFRMLGFSLKKVEGSEMRRRVLPFFDAFHDLDGLSDREVLALARSEGVEVAVDLMGHTVYSRPSLFASRMAPVQASYLGYAGTMGLPSIDYIVADPVLIPERLREHYTEKVAYLPDSYQPNDRKRRIAEGGALRAAHGLPEDAFVFCCFNNNYKITPAVFDSWMRILAAAPRSVLWLFSYMPAVERNLRREAAQRGIDPQRLVFAANKPLPEHLARHRAADLFLDTLPYNAHTTASDALWAGLPVLTLAGDTFASRVAASLLTATGLPELIAASREEYERMALAFYADRDALRAVRGKLLARVPDCALFDSARYTRNLEALLARMAERQRSGLAPDHISV